MNTANIIAIVAAVVSFGSMCAAIASAATARNNARIVKEAKEQAKQAALLERRTEAIGHIRQAIRDVNGYRNPGSSNIRKAMEFSGLTFGREVQEALNRAESKARLLTSKPDQRKEREFQDTLDGLGKELQALLEQMNREAALSDER